MGSCCSGGTALPADAARAPEESPPQSNYNDVVPVAVANDFIEAEDIPQGQPACGTSVEAGAEPHEEEEDAPVVCVALDLFDKGLNGDAPPQSPKTPDRCALSLSELISPDSSNSVALAFGFVPVDTQISDSDKSGRKPDLSCDISVGEDRLREIAQWHGMNGTVFADVWRSYDVTSSSNSVADTEWVRAADAIDAAIPAYLRRKLALFSFTSKDSSGGGGESIQIGRAAATTVEPPGAEWDWLAAALNVLSSRPDLVKRLIVGADVMPRHGVYGVRFHCRGSRPSLRCVLVDDSLPCQASSISTPREPSLIRGERKCGAHVAVLWPFLVHKAYAKLFGSFGGLQALRGGDVSQAMREMTGASIVTAMRILPVEESGLWATLVELLADGDLVGCIFDCSSHDSISGCEGACSTIRYGAAVKTATEVEFDGEMVRLVELRCSHRCAECITRKESGCDGFLLPPWFDAWKECERDAATAAIETRKLISSVHARGACCILVASDDDDIGVRLWCAWQDLAHAELLLCRGTALASSSVTTATSCTSISPNPRQSLSLPSSTGFPPEKQCHADGAPPTLWAGVTANTLWPLVYDPPSTSASSSTGSTLYDRYTGRRQMITARSSRSRPMSIGSRVMRSSGRADASDGSDSTAATHFAVSAPQPLPLRRWREAPQLRLVVEGQRTLRLSIAVCQHQYGISDASGVSERHAADSGPEAPRPIWLGLMLMRPSRCSEIGNNDSGTEELPDEAAMFIPPGKLLRHSLHRSPPPLSLESRRLIWRQHKANRGKASCGAAQQVALDDVCLRPGVYVVVPLALFTEDLESSTLPTQTISSKRLSLRKPVETRVPPKRGSSNLAKRSHLTPVLSVKVSWERVLDDLPTSLCSIRAIAGAAPLFRSGVGGQMGIGKFDGGISERPRCTWKCYATVRGRWHGSLSAPEKASTSPSISTSRGAGSRGSIENRGGTDSGVQLRTSLRRPADSNAGGCAARHSSWGCNPQYILRAPSGTRVVLVLTHTDAGDSAAFGPSAVVSDEHRELANDPGLFIGDLPTTWPRLFTTCEPSRLRPSGQNPARRGNFSSGYGRRQRSFSGGRAIVRRESSADRSSISDGVSDDLGHTRIAIDTLAGNAPLAPAMAGSSEENNREMALLHEATPLERALRQTACVVVMPEASPNEGANSTSVPIFVPCHDVSSESVGDSSDAAEVARASLRLTPGCGVDHMSTAAASSNGGSCGGASGGGASASLAIVACLRSAGVCGAYELSAYSDSPLGSCPIQLTALDANRGGGSLAAAVHMSGLWDAQAGTAGGSRNHPTWCNNPQLALRCRRVAGAPVAALASAVRVVVVLAAPGLGDEEIMAVSLTAVAADSKTMRNGLTSNTLTALAEDHTAGLVGANSLPSPVAKVRMRKSSLSSSGNATPLVVTTAKGASNGGDAPTPPLLSVVSSPFSDCPTSVAVEVVVPVLPPRRASNASTPRGGDSCGAVPAKSPRGDNDGRTRRRSSSGFGNGACGHVLVPCTMRIGRSASFEISAYPMIKSLGGWLQLELEPISVKATP